MTDEIKALEKRVAELEKQLRDAQDLLRKAKLEACVVKVGDIVVNTKDGTEHRVTEVDVRWNDLSRPWVYGNPKKKDGTWGTARRALYHHWKKP